jgi:hypothetical protein
MEIDDAIATFDLPSYLQAFLQENSKGPMQKKADINW